MTPTLYGAFAAIVLLPLVFGILFKVLWKVPSADQALIVTGFGVKGRAVGDRIFKIVTGGGAFVVPVMQKAQYLSMSADKALLEVEGVDVQKIPVGVRGVAKELFGMKGEATGVMKILMMAVFLAAGLLEIVSILFCPISLSFRLYGNIFAGENMLETMSRMVPGLGWLLPIPFYFMELLVGLVQAMVFMLLTAVFTLLICHHEAPQPGVAHGH